MVLVFGYATLSEQEYIQALLGVVPPHFGATLSGYQLCLQEYDCMPEKVQDVIAHNWKPEEFKSYFARKTSYFGPSDDSIRGVVWDLTESQKATLDDWEFEGLWYTADEVKVTDDQGKVHNAFVYAINSGRGTVLEDGFDPYPVDKAKMLRLARKN